MEIISKQQAKSQGLKYYFTNKPCKRGHLSKRRIGNGDCVECVAVRCKQWEQDNRERKNARGRKYYRADPEKYIQKRMECYWNDWDHYQEYRSRPEIKARKMKQWKERYHSDPEFRDLHNARASYRRKTLRQATPKWADKKAIEVVYLEAKRLTRETGNKYTVDHVIPLKAKRKIHGELIACGLHVLENLEIVLASINFSKNCLAPPDVG